MSLWVDKYRPHNLSDLSYHKDQAERLKNMVQQGDFPHLLIYGPPGAGKKTRIMCMLRELYGNGIERLRMDAMQFETPSKKKFEMMTISSNYHIEVNPSDAGIYDRCVVMDLVKTTAQTHQINPSGQKDFKVVLLTNVDQLTKDAQHALRRTMEKYVATCRIILCTNSTSRVLPAIRSRCLGIRIPAPTEEEIKSILFYVAKKELLDLPEKLAARIANSCDRNLRRAILMLEACKVDQYPFMDDQKVAEPDWQIYIRNIATLMVNEQSPKKLLEIRNRYYELLTHAIPTDLIFRGLLQEVTKKCDLQLKIQIAHLAAEYEHRMHQGSKAIFHLEAFTARFMAIYKKFMDASLEGFD
ncbi:hypothetical protein QAD02_024276 [Eretmocerus hayati]|uniref:Uncharacterized protein n=1 Tax=Eretmocerus hayati TaxID=131215 RepID=A0ACC2Q0F3_9HYME|nr:hypothetical protein QAD02_024276 [Eretmocerus hayati]